MINGELQETVVVDLNGSELFYISCNSVTGIQLQVGDIIVNNGIEYEIVKRRFIVPVNTIRDDMHWQLVVTKND